MERYQGLQMHHRHVCDIVAIYWGIEPNEVLDGIIDDNSTLPMFHNLFDEGGRRALMLFYQEGDPPVLGDVFIESVRYSTTAEVLKTAIVYLVLPHFSLSFKLQDRRIIFRFHISTNLSEQNFFFQNVESGRHNPATVGTKTKRIYITDGSTIPLKGKAVVVYRVSSSKAIDMKNVNEVFFFAGSFDRFLLIYPLPGHSVRSVGHE